MESPWAPFERADSALAAHAIRTWVSDGNDIDVVEGAWHERQGAGQDWTDTTDVLPSLAIECARKKSIASRDILRAMSLRAFRGDSGRIADAGIVASAIQNLLRSAAILGTEDSELREIGLQQAGRAKDGLANLRRLLRPLRSHHRLHALSAFALAEAMGICALEPASTWSATLLREAESQIGSDGVHLSRSSFVHLAVTEDLLEVADALTATGRTPSLSVHEMLARMVRASILLSRPNGSPHKLGTCELRPTSLRRIVGTAERALVMLPKDEPCAMFALPSGGFFGVMTVREKLVVSCPDSLDAPLPAAAFPCPFEYCLDGEPVFHSGPAGITSSDGVSELPRGYLFEWLARMRNNCSARWHHEKIAWSIRSSPFRFDAWIAGRRNSPTKGCTVTQTGPFAWRFLERVDGSTKSPRRRLNLHRAWNAELVSKSESVVTHSSGQQIRLRIVSDSGADLQVCESLCDASAQQSQVDNLFATSVEYSLPANGSCELTFELLNA